MLSIPIQLSKQNVALASYLSEREVVDVLMDFPSSRHPPQSILSLLKALQPRYYSIASSPLKVLLCSICKVHLPPFTFRIENMFRSSKDGSLHKESA